MDPFWNLVKVGASLLLVLGIIALTAYAVKRFLGGRLGLWRTQPLIQVLSTTYLGPKKEIAVIEVGKEYLVVGITATQISLLTRLEGPPLPAKPIETREDSRSV
ncbi:MAG: flagellar biosynthetic protein FliO [Nitrospirae bacterium]|nr:flagellar biosynthetic protein FliO [Candidatus Manganitrophaceae bacterium]